MNRRVRLTVGLGPHGRSPFLAEVDDVWITGCGPDIFDLPQHPGRDVPALTLLGYDGNGLPVVSREDTQNWLTSIWLERDAVTDRKFEHSGMGPCLVQETQSFNDAIVEVDQFCFGEAVYFDLQSHSTPPRTGRRPIGIWRYMRPNVQGNRRAATTLDKLKA